MNKETVEVNQYWALESEVSHGYNVLKGKLYNLAESVITDQKQLEAFKGLIKDFSNDAYRLSIENLRTIAVENGMIDEEETNFPVSSYPLDAGHI